MLNNQDTIVAQATAVGQGSVGILRISGARASAVAHAILGKLPAPRQAEYLPFYDAQGQVIDQGLAIFFPNPHSFTGEDVLELQGHGGQVVLSMLMSACLQIANVRPARPGEFSERAFLNDKMDLTQAEAIADLINASTEQAAKGAIHSLKGEFSQAINELVEHVIHLRMYVEAAIDFPEEEIDFLNDGKIATDLKNISERLQTVYASANQGQLLRDGMRVVIAGKPNAGKSSLLNALAGQERAIVTEIAGTTRDTLSEHIQLDGLPLHIIDTAGLRETDDVVEQIGVQRAKQEVMQADHILYLVDASTTDLASAQAEVSAFVSENQVTIPLTLLMNKVDKISQVPHQDEHVLYFSAKAKAGLNLLSEHLKRSIGYEQTSEGTFIARQRHLDALNTARQHLLTGTEQLHGFQAGEILAEELRLCQQALNEITGEFSSDDLLGKIFSSFCIGK